MKKFAKPRTTGKCSDVHSDVNVWDVFNMMYYICNVAYRM